MKTNAPVVKGRRRSRASRVKNGGETMKFVPNEDGSVTLYLAEDVSDLEQVTIFLAEARRRLANASSVAEARLLKTTIIGLEKHFTGRDISDGEVLAFQTVFFGGPPRDYRP